MSWRDKPYQNSSDSQSNWKGWDQEKQKRSWDTGGSERSRTTPSSKQNQGDSYSERSYATPSSRQQQGNSSSDRSARGNSSSRGTPSSRQYHGGSSKPAPSQSAPSAQVKRTSSRGNSNDDAKRAKPGKCKVVVRTTATRDDLGLQTLVGDFFEYGENHGRKTFKKTEKIEANEEGPKEVFLYFWDETDGEEFSGWWFGDEVGGSQVWGKCSDKSQDPPSHGWRVPHDGQVCRELKVQFEGPSSGVMVKEEVQERGWVKEEPQEEDNWDKPRRGKDSDRGWVKEELKEDDEWVQDESPKKKRKEDDKWDKQSSSRDWDQKGYDQKDRDYKDWDRPQSSKNRDKDRPQSSSKDWDRDRDRDHQDWDRPQSSKNRDRDRPQRQSSEMEAKVRKEAFDKASVEVEQAEEEAKQKFEEAKLLSEEVEDTHSLNRAANLLKEATEIINEAQDALARKIKNEWDEKMQKQLQSLSPKLKSLRVKVLTESARAKAHLAKKKKQDEEEEERRRKEKENAEREAKDAKALEETLPGVLEAIGSAETAVEAAALAAEPLSLATELGDQLQETLDVVEKAVASAQRAVKDANWTLEKAQRAAKKFVHEVRKSAENEFGPLQERLEAAQTKLGPLKHAKQEHEERIAGQKILDECMEKIGEAEVEIDQLDTTTITLSKSSDASEDDLKEAQTTTFYAAKDKQTSAYKFVKDQIWYAKGASKTDLEKLLERCNKNYDKLERIRAELKELRYKKAADECISKCTALAKQIDEAAEKCSEAEMAFLTGVEVIPKEDAVPAIEASKVAYTTASAIAVDGRAFLQDKLYEIEKYTPEANKSCKTALDDLGKKLDQADSKLKDFRKDLTQREKSLALQEATAATVEAESKLQAGRDIAKELDENLAELSSEAIAKICEKTSAAEKEANKAYVDASKMLRYKSKTQAHTHFKDAGDTEQAKLQKRLAAVKDGLAQLKKTASSGEIIIKNKEILMEAEAKLKPAEQEIEKADVMSTPVGDERLSDDRISEVTDVLERASKLITAASKYIGQKMNEPESPRDALAKLKAQAKKGHEKLTELKTATRDQVERVRGVNLLTKSTESTTKAEEALQSTSKAEEPFLKGIDPLPLEYALPALEASGTAAEACQVLIQAATSSLKANIAEASKFAVETVSKDTVAKLKALQERTKVVAEKLDQFKKETAERKKNADVVRTVEMMTEAAAEVSMVSDKAVDIEGKDLDNLPEAEAEKLYPVFDKILKSAVAKLEDVKKSIKVREQEVQSNASRKEQVDKLNSRLGDAEAELTKAKRSTQKNMEKYQAKKLLVETESLVDEADKQLAKTNSVTEPLLVQKGESFIAEVNLRFIADVLLEYMKEKNSDKAALFKIAAGGKPIDSERFNVFLESLPTLCNQADLTFSTEQSNAVFAKLDSDNDDTISEQEFMAMFAAGHYVVNNKLSMTDSFDIDESKTFAKLEKGTELVAISDPKSDDKGMMRIQCKAVALGKTGWVTMKSGTKKFLEEGSSYDSWVALVKKSMDDTRSTSEELAKLIGKKIKECGDSDGPLADAKKKLFELKTKASQNLSQIDKLSYDLQKAKQDYEYRLGKQKEHLQDLNNRRQVSRTMMDAVEVVLAAEAAAQKAADVGAPLIDADTDEKLAALSEPADVLSATEAASTAADKIVQDAWDILEKHQKEVTQTAQKGLLEQAKKELSRLSDRNKNAGNKSWKALKYAKWNANQLAKSKVSEIGVALRHSISDTDGTLEDAFDGMKTIDTDSISKVKFCQHVADLKDLSLPKQHIELAFQTIAHEGCLGRRAFLKAFQLYFKCQKEIKMTSSLDISVGKVEKKLEYGEILEVLEGPKQDPLGLSRARCRVLTDGKIGWVTLKGNEGTAFLCETRKPYYRCIVDIKLQDGFSSNRTLRTLKAQEVVEVLEGPKKDDQPALFVKGKPDKEGSEEGWITVRDKSGNVTSRLSDKHFVVKETIVLTDTQSIKECKPLKKLQADDVLEVLEAPEKAADGLTRMRCKTDDGKEGWVTTQGTAGTIYAQLSTRHYIVVEPTVVLSSLGDDSDELGTLDAGATFVSMGETHEDKAEERWRVRCKALADGQVGWATQYGYVKAEQFSKGKGKGKQKKKLLVFTTLHYRVEQKTPIHDVMDIDSAKALRSLELEEFVEALEGPIVGANGLIRLKGCAEKDGVVGWMTVAGTQGTLYLRSVSRD